MVAKWSLSIAKHILVIVNIDYESVEVIVESFEVNERWQSGNVRVQDVRQSGFKVHKFIREMESEIHKTALRVVGQAIGSGHMYEHSMVASDYAIKVIGLIHENDKDSISKERLWQLEVLKRIINNNG